MFFLHCKRTSAGLVLWLTACGGSGGTTNSAETTTEPTTNATTGGTEGPTSGGAPTSGGDTGPGGSAAGTSTTDGADTTVGEVTTTSTTTTVGTTSSGSSETGDSSGDEGGSVKACEVDADCALVDDCCSCEPVGPGEEVPTCGMPECLVTQCTAVGLSDVEVACRFGRCTFIKVDCNPIAVLCKSLPPECPAGQVPSVDVVAQCWTGNCVPAEACNWVPDCSYCDDDESICVTKLQKGPYTVCAPKPVDCGDIEDIDCQCGAQVCAASPPHTLCHDVSDDIACECELC